MLYVYYGNDRDAVIEKSRQRIANASSLMMSPDSYDEGRILALLGGGGLFGDKEIIVVRDFFQEPDMQEFLLQNASDMATSDNLFIVIEEKILKKEKTLFEKTGAVMEEYKLPPKPKYDPNVFNTFSLSDAFADKNVKQLWLLFQEALRRNIAPEEIHGVLWWQVKNMRLVDEEKTNPGLHEFVYGKTQKALKNYTKEKLVCLAERFVRAYHEARQGKRDLAHELEKIILGELV